MKRLESINSWKHDIQNQKIKEFCRRPTETANPVWFGLGPESMLSKELAEHGTELRVIVHDKNCLHRAHLPLSSRLPGSGVIVAAFRILDCRSQEVASLTQLSQFFTKSAIDLNCAMRVC